jgi:hypothetical protein
MYSRSSFTNRSLIVVEPSWLFPTGKRLADGEVAIRAVRNHGLTRLKTQLPAIELYRHYVRLERHQTGDATDFGVGFTI